MTPTLVTLPYSPWSERAAWALDARRIDYVAERYQPVLGEIRLRRLRRGASGPASVPVLVWEGGVIADSDAIARWADQRGSGPTLFPDEAAVQGWEQVAEQALQAGRALALRRVLLDRDAVTDIVPRFLRPLGPVGRWVGATGLRRTLRKYGGHAEGEDVHRERLVGALDKIREGLAKSDGKTLLGAFSYADITVAQTLVYVSPPEPPPKDVERIGIRIARGSRRAFREPVLAERYADLVAWRDALYETWRAPRV